MFLLALLAGPDAGPRPWIYDALRPAPAFEIREPAGHARLTLACRPGAAGAGRVAFEATLINLGRRPVTVYLPREDFPRVSQPFRFPVFARDGRDIGHDLSEPANPFRAHQTRDHDWVEVPPGGRLSFTFDTSLVGLKNTCRKGGGVVTVQWVVSDRLFSHNYRTRDAPRDGPTASGRPFVPDDPRLVAKQYWHAAYADRVIGRSSGVLLRVDEEDRLVQVLDQNSREVDRPSTAAEK